MMRFACQSRRLAARLWPLALVVLCAGLCFGPNTGLGQPAGETCIHFWRQGENSGFARIEGPKPVGTEWKQYEFSGVAPADAAVFCLALQFFGEAGNVWYDDAELSVDGKKLELPNPGFEEGMAHWVSRAAAAGAGKHEIDETVAHSGKRSGRIDATGGYYYWKPEGQFLAVKPGQKITARFWAKCSGR
ncbi:MAG: hypothetical protein FJ279_19805 [Planctomycetes bacterium]|nr:hypothetical protein [Planctomycetota bacterium]